MTEIKREAISEDVWNCYFACVNAVRNIDRQGVDSAIEDYAAGSVLSYEQLFSRLYVVAILFATMRVQGNTSSDRDAEILAKTLYPQVLRICPIDGGLLEELIKGMRGDNVGALPKSGEAFYAALQVQASLGDPLGEERDKHDYGHLIRY